MNKGNKKSPLTANETGLSASNIVQKYRQEQGNLSALNTVLGKLKGVRNSGKCWIAYCPAHNDRHHKSLSVAIGDEGRIMVFCFAGCSFGEIVAALGMRKTDLFSH